MLFELILFLLIGIFFGTLTGLVPGIHINLIGAFLIALSATILSGTNPFYIVTFITAMAITHTFIDFIPSIFLGCPDTDTELSVLPGHELLKGGHGYEAIILTAYGSLAAIFILVLIAFPSIFVISKTYNAIQNLIPYLLIAISILLILLENKKFQATIVFVLTGILGLIVLNLEPLKEPLLPLLTGLFGASMLLISIRNKTEIPEQKVSIVKTKKFKPLLGAVIASPLCSFLPGLGSGQAAIIGNTLVNREGNKKGFLILLGATNTLVMGFSFISLYVISRTRTGATVAIREIAGDLASSPQLLSLILGTTLISGVIAFFLTKNLAKFFSKNINRFDYTKISIVTVIILLLVVFLVSGLLGLVALIVATLTGVYCISLGVRRANMMGCLLIPTIVFYLTL